MYSHNGAYRISGRHDLNVHEPKPEVSTSARGPLQREAGALHFAGAYMPTQKLAPEVKTIKVQSGHTQHAAAQHGCAA
jgi:hypothetical protein